MTGPAALTPEHSPDVALDTSLPAYIGFGGSVLYLGLVVLMVLLRRTSATAAIGLPAFGLAFLFLSSLAPVGIVATTERIGVRRLFRRMHWYDKSSVRIIARPGSQPWRATFVIAKTGEPRWWLRRFDLHLSWTTDGGGGDVTLETLRRMQPGSLEQGGLFF